MISFFHNPDNFWFTNHPRFVVANEKKIYLYYTVEIDTLPVDAVVESSGGKAPLTGFPRKISKAIFEKEYFEYSFFTFEK